MPRSSALRACSYGRSFLLLQSAGASPRRVLWLLRAAARRWPSGALRGRMWVEHGCLWLAASWRVPGARGPLTGASASLCLPWPGRRPRWL